MRYFLLITILYKLHGLAQFSATNLMEYQYGQLLDSDQESFNAIYNKTLLNYRFGDFKATAGFQLYQSPYSTRNYIDPSWLGINYKNKSWEINLGNFGETLGRGILLRSYEIRGALFEDRVLEANTISTGI